MKTFLSISFDSKSIHVAEGGFAKDRLFLQGVHSVEFPTQCVKSDAVIDEPRFAETLRQAIQGGGFKSRNAILTVSNKRAFLKEMALPTAKPRETAGMITSELQQTFNVPPGDVVQYKAIGSHTNDKGEPFTDYRVSALDRELVESCYSAIEYAKLKPAVLDIELNVMDKLLTWADSFNDRAMEDEALVFIDFGYDSSNVYILSREVPLFYRLLDYGVKDVWHLAREGTVLNGGALGDGEKLEDLSLFVGRDVQEAFQNGLKPFFYKLTDEIAKTITFFNNQAKQVVVTGAYLFGPGSRIPDICGYWTSNLNLPVEILVSLGAMEGAGSQLDPSRLKLAGALIRYE